VAEKEDETEGKRDEKEREKKRSEEKKKKNENKERGVLGKDYHILMLLQKKRRKEIFLTPFASQKLFCRKSESRFNTWEISEEQELY